MATGITFVDESTINKVYTALHGENDLTFAQVLAAVKRIQDAGIIFREPVESKPRGPRTKEQDDQDAADEAAGVVAQQPVVEPTA